MSIPGQAGGSPRLCIKPQCWISGAPVLKRPAAGRQRQVTPVSLLPSIGDIKHRKFGSGQQCRGDKHAGHSWPEH